MEVSTIKFWDNLIQTLLRNSGLKLFKVKIFNSVNFQKSKNARFLLVSWFLKQAIIRPNRITLSKVMIDFVGTSIPRKAKNKHYWPTLPWDCLGTPWNQKIKNYAKASFRKSTLRGYTFGGTLRGCVQNHAESLPGSKVNFGKTRFFFSWVFGKFRVEVRLRLQNFRLRLETKLAYSFLGVFSNNGLSDIQGGKKLLAGENIIQRGK